MNFGELYEANRALSLITIKSNTFRRKICNITCIVCYLRSSKSFKYTTGQLKYDGTRAETRFRLSAKRTSPIKSAGASVQSTTAAEVCASAVVMVVMLYTQCSVVVRRLLATHSIRQFPLHFPPPCASQCAIRFQLDSTTAHQLCKLVHTLTGVSSWPW